MLRRSLSWLSARLLARTVSSDVDRLLRGYGAEALFMARHAVRVAREPDRTCHWSRVLTEVEGRGRYRPW